MSQNNIWGELIKHLFLIFLFTIVNLSASDMKELAIEFDLYAGTKASIQWERVFSSPRRLAKYKLDAIPQDIRDKLKVYLINHAADSEQPIVPGL